MKKWKYIKLGKKERKDRKFDKRISKENDELWKLYVKERDEWKCQMCKKQYHQGETGLHAHHIISRVFKETRHDINNGIALCYYCHKVGPNSPHQNVFIFHPWLKENKPEQYEYIVEKIKNTLPKQL